MDTYIMVNGEAVPATLVMEGKPLPDVVVTTVRHGCLHETCVNGGELDGKCWRVYTQADGVVMHDEVVRLAGKLPPIPMESNGELALEFLGAVVAFASLIVAAGIGAMVIWGKL